MGIMRHSLCPVRLGVITAVYNAFQDWLLRSRVSRTCIALSSNSFYFSFTLFGGTRAWWIVCFSYFFFCGYVNNKVSESKNVLLYFTGQSCPCGSWPDYHQPLDEICLETWLQPCGHLLLLLLIFFPSIMKTWKPQVVFLPENFRGEILYWTSKKMVGWFQRLHLDGDESHRVNLKLREQHSPTQLFKKLLPRNMNPISVRNLNLSVTLLYIVWSLYSSQQQGEIFLFLLCKSSHLQALRLQSC